MTFYYEYSLSLHFLKLSYSIFEMIFGELNWLYALQDALHQNTIEIITQ